MERAMSGKTRVAYIGLAGVIGAALITGVSLYLSQHNDTSKASTATSNSRVTVNVAPASTPPAPPTFKPFVASVGNLSPGLCAFVFSEPEVLQEDRLGCIYGTTSVYIYCTVESQSVGNSTVWDEIYYRTNWGTAGYIPDYYVITGSQNAVMPSCVS
jgi:hypothetical protein